MNYVGGFLGSKSHKSISMAIALPFLEASSETEEAFDILLPKNKPTFVNIFFSYYRSQSLSIREMSPGTWSPTKSPDLKPSPGCARCDSTLIPSTRTFSSSCPYRWLMPDSTMALSILEYKTSWCRHHWRIDAIWLWRKLLKEGLADHHLVCSFYTLVCVWGCV